MNSRILGLVAVGLLAGPLQVAHAFEAKASAWLQSVNVEFYTVNADGPAWSFQFVNPNENLRGLVGLDVGASCIYDETCFDTNTQKVVFTKVPTLPVVSDTMSRPDGSACGRTMSIPSAGGDSDIRLEAGCQVDVLGGRACNGGALVSTTASDTFLNLILGPNTGFAWQQTPTSITWCGISA